MRQTAVLAALLVFGSAAFAADPQLLNMVMPDAKILAGMNGNNLRISPFGQYIISKVAALSLEPQKFVEATGFDPLQDITEVLAASNGDRTNPSNLLLVEGTFDVQKIVTAITAHSKNAQVTTSGGATVIAYTNPKTNKTIALAFPSNSIAVAGSLANVQAALIRNAGSPGAIDPALATQVNQLSSTEDEWLVSSVSLASLMPQNATSNTNSPVAQILPVLKNIQSFNGGIKFGDNIVLTGQAASTDPQNAAALAAVIKLIASLAPGVTANNAQLTQLAQLLQTLQVSTDGSAVNISLSVPEAQAETALNNVLKKPSVQPAEERLRRHANGN